MAKPFTMLTAVLLLIVAAVHAYRLYTGFPVMADGHDIPLWASWPAAIVPAFLAAMLFAEARR